MKKFSNFLFAMTIYLALVHQPCRAEDIDIYGAPTSTLSNPNVLIVLDNTSNWSANNQGWPGGITQGQAEVQSLKTLIASLDEHTNVGLMLLTTVAGNPGGFVVFGVRPMTAANKAEWTTWLDARNANITDSGWKAASSANYGAVMFDVFKYFGGYTSPAHATDDVAGSPVSQTKFGPEHYATIDVARADATAYAAGFTGTTGNYISPISAESISCGVKNYVIFIGNGIPNGDDTNLLLGVGGNITAVQPDTIDSGGTKYTGDEWARFLYQTDVNSATGQQNVISYTLNVYGANANNSKVAQQSEYLSNMARVGGGKYFVAQNSANVLTSLQKIFSEIQSVNSVFASSSLPVSVNTQGTYLNQVFIGMFRPDSSGAPRWMGNLKQYQFAIFGSDLKLADKNSNEAISATTGFVTPCAESYWSTDTGTYWNYPGSMAKGGCAAVLSAFPVAGTSSFYSDAPDGEVVEKGGAGQHLRGVSSNGGVLTSSSTFYATRALKTCNGSSAVSCTSLLNFNTANVTSLDATTIDWVRGKDVDNENGNLDASNNPIIAEMRPSAHGDVVHSQPAAVDYGGSTGVVVFYGSNDGVFHAISGNKIDSSGNELWGFIAPETTGRLARLRSNSPLISMPGISAAIVPTPTKKDYFFDGSVAAYQSGSTVWVYATMRRGGRAIYAFDAGTPATPSLKWRKGCFTNLTTDDSSCSTGWSAIGQTWSKPQIGKLDGFAGPVLVFGGGYDTCEDTNSQTRCASTPRKGANIWFVNADTGAIIRTYPTNYSVPGDVKLVNDPSGNITQVYAADSGGNLYRVNVGTYDGTTLGPVGTASGKWTANSAASDIAIANLSEANQNRKFLNGPDIVETATFNAVLIGSGDREHPLVGDYPCANYSTGVTNEFYMIKDTFPSYPGTILTPPDLTDVTTNTTATINANGWFFRLNTCEQSVNKAVSIGGNTSFGTNQPNQSLTCGSNLGTARGYRVNVLTGAPAEGSNNMRSVVFTGGGLPPSPVAGVVDVGGLRVPFILGSPMPGQSGGASALEGGKVTINPKGTRARTYWYIKNK